MYKPQITHLEFEPAPEKILREQKIIARATYVLDDNYHCINLIKMEGDNDDESPDLFVLFHASFDPKEEVKELLSNIILDAFDKEVKETIKNHEDGKCNCGGWHN